MVGNVGGVVSGGKASVLARVNADSERRMQSHVGENGKSKTKK